MMSDCNILTNISVSIKTWIDEKPNVKEESLSDKLLSDISYHIKKIKYKEFSRHVEAKVTGADWEWWFIYEDSAYKFRIQAKKIFSNNYRSLNYANKYNTQIEKLIENAQATNSLPLYLFYTNKVEQTKCEKKIADEGVFVVAAQELYDNFILPEVKFINEKDILNHSIALSCLLCCPNNKKQETRFNHLYPKHIYKRLGIYNKRPQYVENLLQLMNDDMPSLSDFIFSRELVGIESIMLFDCRGE